MVARLYAKVFHSAFSSAYGWPRSHDRCAVPALSFSLARALTTSPSGRLCHVRSPSSTIIYHHSPSSPSSTLCHVRSPRVLTLTTRLCVAADRDPNFTLSYATLCWRNAHIPILARALLHADAAELNLSYNEILGEGAVALAAALAAGALPSLKKLDLRSTDICNGGIASLVALLDRGACPLLAEIVIDCTNCSKTQHQQLEEAGRRRTPPVIIKLAPRKGAAQIVRIGLPANSV